ncbi:MAG: helix-turn-helix transcriptional regulator [Micropruina sp.]
MRRASAPSATSMPTALPSDGKGLGLTQADVAERMGVTKSRVSQIERGEVSTVDVIARYVQAIGGHLQISAIFGDDLFILRSADTSAA